MSLVSRICSNTIVPSAWFGYLSAARKHKVESVLCIQTHAIEWFDCNINVKADRHTLLKQALSISALLQEVSKLASHSSVEHC